MCIYIYAVQARTGPLRQELWCWPTVGFAVLMSSRTFGTYIIAIVSLLASVVAVVSSRYMYVLLIGSRIELPSMKQWNSRQYQWPRYGFNLQLSLLSVDFSVIASIDYRLLNITGRHGDQAAYAHKHHRMLQS